MITPVDDVTLKSGEVVQAAIIQGPEPEWAQRMVALLSHKGDPWNWQNAAVLERTLDLDAFFHVLHRDGQPFANIMTIEKDGVGIFGHVWTKPEDRKKGASSQLMEIQMSDFQRRGGRALYLTTGSPVAFRLYERFGFREIEPNSGLMTYTDGALNDFEASYFGLKQAADRQPLSATIQALEWRHWPTACPLFFSDCPGFVRAASLGLLGRSTPEGPLLPLLNRAETNPEQAPRVMVLELDNGAVAGLAAWEMHPVWPDTCIIDLYCHEHYWSQGGDLLNSLTLPAASRYIAYNDPTCPPKSEVLTKAGFSAEATLQDWLPHSSNAAPSTDLIIFTRRK